ncbi:pimeloyl-ACP methyl ester carboxylesterase [Labedella gwakjiensis]|uniref:Alpha/beta hydrolase n=1 Tax=Labedella gwakjiensis TaxID=390269 RepID=A0A2P8GY81_9MICO|nr:alpha/beta hydrolase [Labedella gwakjiensis]PSL38895.1 pimeloyl-ACP methyl ester carboxylesterase [Labedella gwakjiensis]RUQ86639.1 alpha/beta hydrolase [Labedella gwakjiensis]
MSDGDTTDEFRYLSGQAVALGLDSVPAHRRSRFTDRDGRAVSAIEWSTGGPEVTFLHGAGLNAHTWDATALALGLPALAVDLPGHGHSDWRDDVDYRAETNAAAVFSVLERVGSDCQLIVGQSLGGLTAAVLAATNPGTVCGLVVVDITPSVDTSTGAAAVRDFLDGPDVYATREEIVDRAIAFGIGTDRDDLSRGVFLNTRPVDGGFAFRHHLANLGGAAPLFDADKSGLWSAFERLTVPVLLVRASHGFLTDELEEEFLTRVPGSRSLTIDGGHNLQEQAPTALAHAITSALEVACADSSASVPSTTA